MQDDKEQLTEFLKAVSSMISGLASDLDSYVEDETDQQAKRVFKSRIADAEKMSAKLDETILRITLNR